MSESESTYSTIAEAVRDRLSHFVYVISTLDTMDEVFSTELHDMTPPVARLVVQSAANTLKMIIIECGITESEYNQLVDELQREWDMIERLKGMQA